MGRWHWQLPPNHLLVMANCHVWQTLPRDIVGKMVVRELGNNAPRKRTGIKPNLGAMLNHTAEILAEAVTDTQGPEAALCPVVTIFHTGAQKHPGPLAALGRMLMPLLCKEQPKLLLPRERAQDYQDI